MKNLFLALVATVLFSGGVFATEIDFIDYCLPNTYYECSELNDSNAQLTLVWGRVSKNCKGFGICDIGGSITIGPITIVFRENTDGRNDLVFSLDENHRNYTYQHFKGNIIVIEEDYVLSDDVCSQLGVKSGYTIKAGNYNMSQNKNSDGKYTIIF